MIIASPEFPLVLAPFLVIYWSMKKWVETQKILLLLGGYGFYSLLNWQFTLILLLYTLFIGLLTQATQASFNTWKGKFINVVIVIVSIGLLAYFKYYKFTADQALQIFQYLGLKWEISVFDVLLPIGISFYIFQAISYALDIKSNKRVCASRLDLALYLCFLPTLLAGPICRSSELLVQIESPNQRQIMDLNSLMLLVTSFVIKKIWLASWLAQAIVDPVFAAPESYGGAELLMAALAYSLQIYFDFSGYTDLATAFALLLGYKLPINFSLPYLSGSLSEFWGRWHISLSRWMRDYIYFPLGGNRLGFSRTLTNIFLVMLISGIWHGAAIKYIIWGAYHGIGLCTEKASKLFISTRLGIIITFIFVSLGWIFFRSSTIDSALIYFKGFLDWGIPMNPDFPHLGIALLALTSFAAWNYSEKLINLSHLALYSLPLAARPIPIALIITISLALSPAGMPNFIYSQF